MPKPIYLCGPMSGCIDDNYPNFHEAARRLRADGWQVENPAENTPPACGSWLASMRISIRQMMKCGSVVTLPGWQDSKGARAEVTLACTLGIPVKTNHEGFVDLKASRPSWLRRLITGNGGADVDTTA